MQRVYSKPLRFLEGEGYLHGFSTGTVRVKTTFKTAKGSEPFAMLNLLLDTHWTMPLPILVWVIDHPEGVFVVDTGENIKVLEEDYFKEEGFFKFEGFLLHYLKMKPFQFQIKSEEEVGPQLTALGYTLSDIKQVILTHLHLDHFDGLHYFEHNDILINRLEWEKPSFTLPSLYPDWFTPKLATLSSEYSHFSLSKALTQSGEIQLVHTPGHTMGHCSVLVQSASLHYLLAGDATYDQNQLVNNVLAGAHQSFKQAKKAYQAIKKYAHQHPMVYLPSHDPQSLERLEKDLVLVIP
ncbi:MAG: N-acyl homoserine lactonase family protein [Thermonemataceae bacterium]